MIILIIVSTFEKILHMKNKLFLLLSLTILVFASSCTKNLSVHKRRYSDGYYVSISDKKKNNANNLESKQKKNSSKVESHEIIANQTYLEKVVNENDVSKEKFSANATLKHSPAKKFKSASKSLPIIKHQEKEFNTALNFVEPHKTKRANHHNTPPFNGFFFDQSSSSIWFAIGGILAALVTVIFFIFIISALGVLTFSFPFFFPLLLIIGLIVLLTVGVLVLLNAS
jgi:hypothetical protein